MADIVLTIIGDDRPGLVGTLASVVTDVDGSWTQSHMSRLGGKFAGIAVVSIDAARADDLDRRLDSIRDSGLLQIVATTLEARAADAPPTQPDERGQLLTLQLVGADRTGIISEITQVLAANDVGIVELESSTSNAPMSGELLFEASLVLSAPPSLSTAALQHALEALADELMVDVEFGSFTVE